MSKKCLLGISVLAMCLSVLVVLSSRNEVGADIYRLDASYCAIVKHGTAFDSAVAFWICHDRIWRSYYVDHEFFAWERYSLGRNGDEIAISKNGKPFARFDILKMEMSHSGRNEQSDKSHDMVWSDDDGTVCMSYVEDSGNGKKTYPAQRLSDDNVISKSLVAITREISLRRFKAMQAPMH